MEDMVKEFNRQIEEDRKRPRDFVIYTSAAGVEAWKKALHEAFIKKVESLELHDVPKEFRKPIKIGSLSNAAIVINNKLKQFNIHTNTIKRCEILNQLKTMNLSSNDKTYLLTKLNTLRYTKGKFLFGNPITNKITQIKTSLTSRGGSTKKKIGVYQTGGGYYYRRFRNGDVKRISKDEYKKRK